MRLQDWSTHYSSIKSTAGGNNLPAGKLATKKSSSNVYSVVRTRGLYKLCREREIMFW